jgi:hypothetical protein
MNRSKRKRAANSHRRTSNAKLERKGQLTRKSTGVWAERQDFNDKWLSQRGADWGTLSVAKRGRAALEAQAFLRGTIRARLRRMYPNLSPREITFKYFEEVANGG